ncbi:MAG: polysaccharide pyruvyl transferase family protein [Actinobacteria bacterium]|nr:polysaccharide pyruvyl transferase family protein [Actinomycetota bacterium]
MGGWFSFSGVGATVGDLLAKDVVCEWLERADRTYDVALDVSYGAGVDWRTVDPSRYSEVIFVCGPFYRSDLLRRFEGCRLIGVNLSMAEPIRDWNPFDLLLERDSSEASHPDITFCASVDKVPVVGLTLLPPAEAGTDLEARYREASEAAVRLLERRGTARVTIDTGLGSGFGTTSPMIVTSLMTRMDAIVTTRLHGLVLALRGGVPALAIEPVPGGGKLARQGMVLGWPAVVQIDELTDAALDDALDFCLSQEGREKARACADRAVAEVGAIGDRFVVEMTHPGGAGDGRRNRTWLFEGSRTPASERSDRGYARALAGLRSRLKRGIGRSSGR